MGAEIKIYLKFEEKLIKNFSYAKQEIIYHNVTKNYIFYELYQLFLTLGKFTSWGKIHCFKE